MNRHEVCTGREGAFDLELGEGRGDGGQDVSATKHGLTEGHEVGDRVEAIANELLVH